MIPRYFEGNILANPNKPPCTNELDKPFKNIETMSIYQADVVGKYCGMKGIDKVHTIIMIKLMLIFTHKGTLSARYKSAKFPKNKGQVNTNPNVKLGSYFG